MSVGVNIVFFWREGEQVGYRYIAGLAVKVFVGFMMGEVVRADVL